MNAANTFFVDAADGTRLAAHERGAGRAVVLTNGLSTTPNFWAPLVRVLSREHRVVDWDYRGHGESESARTGDYAITTHADDLARVTDAVVATSERDARPPVHVAFSMGVAVLLELVRRRPERVGAMVLVAGGPDQPHASSPIFRVPGVKAAIRTALAAGSPLVPRSSSLVRRVASSRAIFPLAQAVGAIGKGAPRAEVEHFFRTVGAMDLRAYVGSVRSLLDAHASDVLPTIRVPVLVVIPASDVLASRKDLDALVRAIPGAERFDVPGTSHAMLLEAGDAIAQRVKNFLVVLSEK